MQFNEREDIKGDFAVSATGATSLVAKEVRAKTLAELKAVTKDDPYVKQGEMTRELFRTSDMDPERFVYSDDEFEERQRALAEAQAQAEANRQQQTAAA
jgi:hypothetical protein